MGKCPSTKVDAHVIQRKTLALMYGDCPCESHWKLLKQPNEFLNNSTLPAVVNVTDIFPGFGFNSVDLATNLDANPVVVQSSNLTDSAIDPAAVFVILDHHHFRANLQFQNRFRWKTGLRDLPFDTRLINKFS